MRFIWTAPHSLLFQHSIPPLLLDHQGGEVRLTGSFSSLLNLIPSSSSTSSNQGKASNRFQGRMATGPGSLDDQVGSVRNLAVSPYWADPEGHPANQAPDTVPDDLNPSPPSCREVPVPCNSSARYRSLSGRCNNLQHPHLGTSGQPMPRILPPVYDFSLMRTLSITGSSLLPNPRVVSLRLRQVSPQGPTHHSPSLNLLLMQFGQFIDHDLSVFAEINEFGREGEKKCGKCDSWVDPACAPIPIPEADPHLNPHLTFSDRNKRCLPFTRSGALGGRDSSGRTTLDQLSLNTAFFDLSTVYGSDHCRGRTVRLYSGGRMVEVMAMGGGSDGQGQGLGRGFPPQLDQRHFKNCRTAHRSCFFSGDERSNENLGLMIMHIVFLREHNTIANRLTQLNAHWDDETIFQEARRINIAQYQHIIFKEFLPLLVGRERMAHYQLEPLTSGYYQGYDATVNPGILNEFSTAAFRVGHTMVPDHLTLADSSFLPLASVSLVQTFHNASMALLPGMCDKVLRGILATRLKPVDLLVVSALTDRLFEGQHESGQDLFAINIARGRDHGLAPYVQYREACGGSPTTTFQDLLQVMSSQAVEALSQTYDSVLDIDLFAGGLGELSVSGGVVGPTFACILSYQFLNLRRADRFWYETGDNGLTLRQLDTIRSSASLSRLLCANMDQLLSLPFNVFFLPSNRENPLESCERGPAMSLEPWREDLPQTPRPPIHCTYLGHRHQPSTYVPVSPCLSCLCHTHGQMECKPNLAGCQQSQHDEHCRLVC
ncbi:hypothetical protein Pmani_003568 [Petrolisthes manimaculis]|uniref:Peroxidase n=1 Tax=Petrolisthes manimaculis TaxID=1843537 RepID=A0AAE1UPV9_9EUCA|nr:hypothetical protein Pmani_003568 [Petrolisthes manimaculis]